VLSILGLGAAEELAYRHLVGRPGVTVAKLAADLGHDPASVGDSVRALADRGLVIQSHDGVVSAAPPAVALGALLRERHDELRSAELDLIGLIDAYRSRVTDRATGDLVEVITDVDAVRHRFNQIQQAARHEFRSMVVPNLQVVPAAANEAGDAGLKRGVRYRSIVDQGVLAQSGGASELARSLAAGEEIRVVDRIPVKLVVADNDVAMVPLYSGRNTAPESVLIRASGLLDALVAYFDDTWARAYPVVSPSPAPSTDDGVDSTDRQLLTLLLAGLTDQAVASQLGMSLRSVQRRISTLMTKVGAATRIQLGWHAARNGWA
jgi:sugar-specific transcriptional regulator TrmB/DNA-binding CsgD family transcriptional regulator